MIGCIRIARDRDTNGSLIYSILQFLNLFFILAAKHLCNKSFDMGSLVKGKTALLLVDIHMGFDNIDCWGGQRNNPGAGKNASELLSLWRKYRLPFFQIHYCSSDPASILAPGSPGNEFKEMVKPLSDEPVIQKNVTVLLLERIEKQGLIQDRQMVW